MTTAEGTALLDLAMGRDDAQLAAVNMKLATLRGIAAQGGALPPLLHGLAGAPARRIARAATTDREGPTLRERLARADEADRGRLVFDLVRSEVAVVLGDGTPENIQMELSFPELGLDSASLTDFRNQLNQIAGLRLPITAVYDYPTPALLAEQIHEELSAAGLPSGDDSPQRGRDQRRDRNRYLASTDAAPLADTNPAHLGVPEHSLGGLYVQAEQAGKIQEVMRLIIGLAAFRPVFSAPSELEYIPDPVPFSQGPTTPGLICLPSFVGRSGVREYVRFAREFRGIRNISVVSEPGFIGGEPLAASVDALVAMHADNIRKSVNDTPFVLGGHSTGGLVAHALATHLESIGMAPAALVVMDTYPLEGEMSEGHWRFISSQIMADIKQQENVGEDAWLTAMAHYLSLGWSGLKPTAIPTLMVQATEAMSGFSEDRERWTLSSDVTVVKVPGNHFTMMVEHADTTARAVSEWLDPLK